MPAKAGIQGRRQDLGPWIPAFAGMTRYSIAPSLPRGLPPAFLAQQLPIADPGLETVGQALQAEELVGRVIVLIGGGEGEEDRLRAERLAEDEADGNRRTHAHAQGG